jgi:hypothetical protein
MEKRVIMWIRRKFKAFVIGFLLLSAQCSGMGCFVPAELDTADATPEVSAVDNKPEKVSSLSNPAREAFYAVLSAWDEVYGEPVKADCYTAMLYDVEVRAVDPIAEGWAPTIGGWANDGLIRYDEKLQGSDLLGVLAHEWVHEVGCCQINDPDNLHVNPKMFTCEGSVERVADDLMDSLFRSSYTCALEVPTPVPEE